MIIRKILNYKIPVGKIKNFLKFFILVLAFVFLILLTVDIIKSDFLSGEEDENKEFAYNISEIIIQHLDDNYFMPEDRIGSCNVSGIELHGFLATYIPPENYDEEGYSIIDFTASENIISAVKIAEKDESIKAILLEVDSLGGYPVAAEEVANILKWAKKPTVVLIRESGLSAGYWAATGADIIFASELSDVGSIGITSSYLDNVEKNRKDGFNFVSLSSGKYKDTGDPNKSLTQEEKDLIMEDINKAHNIFVKAVAENRNIDIEKVKALADGSSMLGKTALKNGLIDKIGSFKEVEEYIKEKTGEEAKICW